MAHQQEDAVGGRLLEHLEQSVGGGGFEIVGGVDDDRAPWRQERGRAEQAAEAAHLLDADVAREAARGGLALDPLEHPEIGVAAGVEQPDDRVIARGFDPGEVARWAGGVGEDPAYRGPCEARLADPARTRE